MASAQEYQARIESIVASTNQSVTFSTSSEAKQFKKELIATQKQVRQIKTMINAEIKELRAQYKQRDSSAGTGGQALLGILGKRGLGRSYRASARSDINAQRDQAIAPYESVKFIADDVIIQLDRAKLQVDSVILKLQGEEQTAKTKPAIQEPPVAEDDTKPNTIG